MIEHILKGCTMTPLSNYLKSLGLLRVLSEQTEFEITGYWKHEKFIIRTEMSGEDIVEFMLKKYTPTPILIPWSDNKYQKTVKALGKTAGDERFAAYEKLVGEIELVNKELENIPSKKKDKKSQKEMLLKQCRNMLSDEIIQWLDAVFVLTDKGTKYAPILGSGGNDGNYDMAENFVDKITMLLSDDKKTSIKSEKWLRYALFDEIYSVEKGSVIGHNPDGDGDTAPNSGMGFTGKSLSNPWDYVLMVEGALLFAGNIARRQSANSGKAVFPFSTDISSTGYATASDEEDSRGEIWVPVWRKPTTYSELSHIFKEGRVQIGRKQAETGSEFARAVISLGTERGIDEFSRYCVMKRKGDAHLYIYAGTISAGNDHKIGLLEELDEWYKEILRESKKKEASASLKRLIRNHDTAVMNYCKSRKNSQMLEILASVGRIHRHVSKYENMRILQELSPRWIESCYDNSVEFRLALSIASIQSLEIGNIRENLENVKLENGQFKNEQKFLTYVWNENDDLVSNINRVLMRRALDGKKNTLDQIPISGSIPARVNDIIEFLNGQTDTKKISELVLPLSMIDLSGDIGYPWKNTEHQDLFKVGLPQAYAIMKLIYPPDRKENIPYDMTVLNLLSGKRVKEAYAKASYILHSHGISPKTYMKDRGAYRETVISDILEKFLMASILFPISYHDRRTMLALVTVQSSVSS